MSKSFTVGVVIGASLASSFSSVFKTAEARTQGLRQSLAQAELGKAIAADLVRAKTQLAALRSEVRAAGGADDALRARLLQTAQAYGSAARRARDYGMSVSTLVGKQQEFARASDLAQRALARQDARERNQSVRSELGGQVMGTAGMVMSLAAPIREAVQFESVMADVKKVMDFDTPQQFEQMSRDLLSLTTQIPMSYEGLGQIAAAAGQAGIAREELLRFVQDAARMGVAFDMGGEAAGSAMTGLRSIFQLNQDQVVRLGDAYNHLSNNMDATARDMLSVANRAGSTAQLFGLSGEQLGALSATFLALKTPPEVAGTGINALLLKLKTADKQGKSFQDALAAMGMSAKDLKQAIEKDAQGTLVSFLEQVKGAPDVMGTLSDLFGAEYADDIAKLVNGLDGYKQALGLVADETQYAGSMQQEYEARAATTANSLQLLKNRLARAGVTLGSLLLPPLNQAVGVLGSVVDKITAWASANPRLFSTLLGIAAGAVGAKVALLGLRYGATLGSDAFQTLMGGADLARKALGVVSGAAPVAASAFSGLSSALPALAGGVKAVTTALVANPVGLIVAGIAGAALLVWKYWEPLKSFFAGLWEGISTAAAPAVEALGSALAPLGQVLGPVFAGLGDLILPVWEGIQGLGSAIGELFGNLFTQAGPSEAARSLGQRIGSALGEGVSAVAAGIGGSITAIAGLWDGATAAASAAWAGIGSAAGAGAQAVASVLSGLGATFSSVWGGVTAAASAAFGGVVTVVGIVQGAVQGVLDQVGGLAASLGASVQTAFGAVLGALAQFNPLPALQVVIAQVQAFLASVNLAEAGRAILQTLADGVMSAIGSVVGAVKTAFDKVKSFLPGSDADEGPLSRLTASGRAIPTTIGEGIAGVGGDPLTRPLAQAFGQLRQVAGTPGGAAVSLAAAVPGGGLSGSLRLALPPLGQVLPNGQGSRDSDAPLPTLAVPALPPMPGAAPAAGGGQMGGGVVVNFSPVINVSSGAGSGSPEQTAQAVQSALAEDLAQLRENLAQLNHDRLRLRYD